MKLGLTPAQLAERRKGIGGSDARYIVEGEWHSLWMDKTGRAEPVDLSRVLVVQMGHATEEFNAYWYKLLTGKVLVERGAPRQHSEYPFMRCTLDGIVANKPAMVWQAKHVNAFSKIEEVVARYTPQVTHEMIVCGLNLAVLSVFIGTDKFEAVEIELDEFFAATYVDRCREFWGYVERDEPPPQGAPLAVPAPVEKFRTISMQSNNAWGDAAARWIANKDPAKLFEASVKDIKALIEPDVGEAEGHGITVKRSKAGALTIKESK